MASTGASSSRVGSIDLIRGAVMVVMAIDHVRVFSGLPGGGPTPGIFFTRWVTHFCAPAFFFLAGTSAFLYGRHHADLGRFLLIRGLWLVLLELTVIRFAWTFNVDYPHYALAGVIWALGWCMVLMSVFVRLTVPAVGGIGLVVVFGHNLFDYLPGLTTALAQGPFAGLWKVLYLGFFQGPIVLSSVGPQVVVLYSIVPWIGVMAVGYAFGAVVTAEPPRRRRWCLAIGLGAMAMFVALRGFNLYGNPAPWRVPAGSSGSARVMLGFFSFLSPAKYPASLDFLLMTLGPTIALMPMLDRAKGAVARALMLFGRVPLFFYLLHIPLIHLLAIGVSVARSGYVNPWLFANHPMANPDPPDGYAWSLMGLYLVWAMAVALLYVACRWFAGVKARSGAGWLRYV
jgi:uncharacterized membrane protein